MPSSPRRRPPSPPPDPDDPVYGAAPAGGGAFRLIAGGGAIAIVAVVAIAVLTGTADDLPWGALIGVLILLVAMLGAARRRERRMRETFPDDE